MIPYNIISELIVSGCKFSYESYNYKEALEEYKNSSSYDNWLYGGIPDEFKLKHIVWRTGKLRQVYFNNYCKLWKFKIGNKYIKSFFIEDFGVRVKPIIFKSDDKYDLISKGFAVEDSL